MLLLDASACPPPVAVMATDRLLGMSTAPPLLEILASPSSRLAVLDGPRRPTDRSFTSASKGSMPASAERAYAALAPRSTATRPWKSSASWIRIWRIAGNPGFNASVDHIRVALEQAGVESRVEEFANARPRMGLSGRHGVVRGQRAKCCCRASATASRSASIRSRRRLAAIEAPLVDVGSRRAAADYEGKDVKGAVVLGSADAGQLWQQAVKARGAIGVISTSIAPYIRPDDPATVHVPRSAGRLPVGQRAVRRAAKAFGFKASWRAAARMRERLKDGPVTVKVDVQSTFYDGPSRSLVAEIPGTVEAGRAHRDGRAHPGARRERRRQRLRDAVWRSCVALHSAIEAGALPAPGRTLTFIWARRESRQPHVADGASRSGEGRAIHVRDGHDRRGRREDRRHPS